MKWHAICKTCNLSRVPLSPTAEHARHTCNLGAKNQAEQTMRMRMRFGCIFQVAVRPWALGAKTQGHERSILVKELSLEPLQGTRPRLTT